GPYAGRQRPRHGRERGDDQRVPDEDGHRLAVRTMDRRTPPTEARVVEARQIVVDERRAVEELDGGGGARRSVTRAAMGIGDRERETRAHPSPAGEYRVRHRLAKTRRASELQRVVQRVLDELEVSLKGAG